MIKLENISILIAENPYNLGIYQIIEIPLVLCIAYVILRDQGRVMFYVNNYMDWDQLNQSYNPNWMEKNIQNIDVVARKLKLALIRIINQKLEVVKEERQKSEKIMKMRKIEAIAVKHQKVKRGINSSSKKEENYKSKSKDKIDPNQAGNNKNPLQL